MVRYEKTIKLSRVGQGADAAQGLAGCWSLGGEQHAVHHLFFFFFNLLSSTGFFFFFLPNSLPHPPEGRKAVLCLAVHWLNCKRERLQISIMWSTSF